MTYTNITPDLTDVDGYDVDVVNSLKSRSGTPAAEINREMLIVTGTNGKLRGNYDIIQSQLWLHAVQPRSGDQASPLAYWSSRSDTTRSMRLLDNTHVIITPTSRTDVFLSEVSGGSVFISDGSQNLYVYTQDGAVMNGATFIGIRNLEIVGPFDVFNDVSLIDTQIGMFNWQSGRIDRYGVNIPSTTSGWFSHLGTNNGGNNSFWDWNPVSIDPEKILHQSSNSRYYSGYTASYRFVAGGSNIGDVLVIYRDNSADPSSSTKAVLGRYETGPDGILEGTYDSRTRGTVASGDRPTLFIRTIQSRITSGTSATSSGFPSTRNYAVDTVTPSLEVRSYAHIPVAEADLSISTEIGRINPADLSVDEYVDYVLAADPRITETSKSTVDAYTEIETAEKLYDRFKSYWRDTDGVTPITMTDTQLNLGSYDLIVDKTATSAFSVSGNDITVKADTFTSSLRLVTTGTVTVDNGAVISAQVSDSTGVDVTVSSAIDAFVMRIVRTDTDAEVYLGSVSDGSHTVKIPANTPIRISYKADHHKPGKITDNSGAVGKTIMLSYIPEPNVSATVDITGLTALTVNSSGHVTVSDDLRNKIEESKRLFDEAFTSENGVVLWDGFDDATNTDLDGYMYEIGSEVMYVDEDVIDFRKAGGLQDINQFGIDTRNKDKTTAFTATFVSGTGAVTFDTQATKNVIEFSNAGTLGSIIREAADEAKLARKHIANDRGRDASTSIEDIADDDGSTLQEYDLLDGDGNAAGDGAVYRREKRTA